MKKLAESIILQCIEDLWDQASIKQSAEFFGRRGFGICAGIAGMDICDQLKLLELVNRAVSYLTGKPRIKDRSRKRWFRHTIGSSPQEASSCIA